jgi:hypothetical protein
MSISSVQKNVNFKKKNQALGSVGPKVIFRDKYGLYETFPFTKRPI